MEKYIILLTAIVLVSCKKSNNTDDEKGAGLFENTEWVGVNDGRSRQYPEPCCLKFKTEKNLTMFSVFYLFAGAGSRLADSVNGKITSIDTLPDGRYLINANFPDLDGDHAIYVTNRKEITMGPADPNNFTLNSHTYAFSLFPSAGVSIKSTTWSGPVMSGGPTNGRNAYPDLSTISFVSMAGRDFTTYTRNGQVVPANPTPQMPSPGVLEVAYQTRGARVYMSGYNEDAAKLVSYFGVLGPSGDKIWVTSISPDRRLPNYLATIDWYGPKGSTPVILKR